MAPQSREIFATPLPTVPPDNRFCTKFPTIAATINPRIGDRYRYQLVARLEPELPNLLAHKAKENNAHADEQDRDLFWRIAHRALT